MIGVVVWSNGARKQAVIWCEDHAALAYLAGEEHCVERGTWPEPGDMVELEDEVVGDLRCARRVRLLTDERLSLLPELLRRRRDETAPSARHLMMVSNRPGPVAPLRERAASGTPTRRLGLAVG